MLYYRCIYGYFADNAPQWPDPIPFSDFVELDDGYIGIPTTYEESFPDSDKNPQQFRTTMLGTLGVDYLWLTIVPAFSARTGGPEEATMRNAVGLDNWGWFHDTAYRYIPNLIEYYSWNEQADAPNWASEHPGRDIIDTVLYFPDLNKGIVLYGPSRGNYDIENGNFVMASAQANSYSLGLGFTQSINIPILDMNYSESVGLSDLPLNVMGRINATINSSGSRDSEFILEINQGPYAKYFWDWFFESNPTPDSIDEDPQAEEDPYLNPDNPEQQPTGEGGGDGNWGTEHIPIGDPGDPGLSGLGLGLFRLFSPTEAELQQLGQYMWGQLDLTNWQKIITDPMDAILGLSIIPVTPNTGGGRPVYVGNTNTGITMREVTDRWYDFSCGTIHVNFSSGNTYLDYSPYTEFELYLPFIGARPIKADDIMNRDLTVKYKIDVMSGACVAMIYVNNGLLYQFIGQCAMSVPITGGDWTNILNGVLSAAGAIGSAVATQGATAPLAVSSIASLGVNMSKPQIEKSGVLAGVGGMLCQRRPYLIRTYPRRAISGRDNVYNGYPSFITDKVGSFQGLTKFYKLRLSGVKATQKEKSEIESILKSEVII